MRTQSLQHMIHTSPPLPQIDAYWSGLLGGSPRDLYADGPRLIAGADIDGFCAVQRRSVLAACGPQISTAQALGLAELLGGAEAEREARLRAAAQASGLAQVYGPAVLCYSTQAPPALSLPVTARRLAAADQGALELFLQRLGEPREYRADEPARVPWLLGIAQDGALVGVSAVMVWAGLIGEVFVDVLPEVRSRGLGTALAAAAARWAVDAGFIAQYDTPWSNSASLAVARRLGFTPYADFLIAQAY